MTAGELCTRRVIFARPDETVAEAAARMLEEHVGDLVVADERDGVLVPVGILTDRDVVLRVVAPHRSPAAVRVADVMARDVRVVDEDDPIERALEAMRLHGVRRIPVVGRGGALIGIVTFDDLVEWVIEQAGGLVGALRQAERRERGLGAP